MSAFAATLLVGCGQKSNPAGLAGSAGSDTGHQVPTNTVSCNTPQEGCPCDTEAEVIDCGSVARHSEGYTACSMGQRICQDGKWGACEGDKIAMLPDAIPGVQTQGLGTTKACVDNPCDPYCQVVVDDSAGLDVSANPGLVVDNGLKLTAVPPDPSANTCTGIKLDPPTQTLTVTAINPTTGLLGEYYNQFDKTIAAIPNAWTVTASRVDANVDFDWGNNAPGPTGIGANGFSVKWTGKVWPPASGDYTFYVVG
ncbi:MAG TPA: PA14 domain-containing protein, partial [Polyangiaceae bacterium]|nr:PA14 domain-containing protein [Polyangiaceae bacterium]